MAPVTAMAQHSSKSSNTAPTSASPSKALKTRQSEKIAQLKDALISSGFATLTQQAAVLGLSRSTAWAVLKADYKSSGISASVINRILRSPQLPPTARRILDEYVQEKLLGAYGHPTARLLRFRSQLGYPTRLLPIR